MNIYKSAMLSQGACNLGGLIHGWARAMTEIQRQAHEAGHGTAWINEHPVNVLFAQQVFHLTNCHDALTYSRAYDVCATESERAKERTT